jgi:hypothetical protein
MCRDFKGIWREIVSEFVGCTDDVAEAVVKAVEDDTVDPIAIAMGAGGVVDASGCVPIAEIRGGEVEVEAEVEDDADAAEPDARAGV